MKESKRRPTPSVATIGFASIVITAMVAEIAPRPACAQVVADSLRPISVLSFDRAVSVAATSTDVFIVDAGATTVTRLSATNGEAEVYSGSGGRLQSASDVDPTNGLTILVCDQEGGSIHRLSRELTLINILTTLDVGGRMSLRPSRLASIDERTMAILDGPTSRVLRWTSDRGFDQRFGTTAGVDAAETPTDLAADAHSVYVADRATGCLYVYDTMGSFVRRMACESASPIEAVNLNGGRLWVTRPSIVESWLPDGTLVARYAVPGGLDVKGAVGTAGRVWLITPKRLYVSSN